MKHAHVGAANAIFTVAVIVLYNFTVRTIASKFPETAAAQALTYIG